MIFLNLNKIRSPFVVIDDTYCEYQDSDEGDRCGLATNRGLEMPFTIPAMPLCVIHAYEYRDWTMDDSIREFVEIMTEPDMLRGFKEDSDDDF